MSKLLPKTPATMSDIARLAGVSASTVSRALAGSELVAKHKREEIVKLARERGYVINSAARHLRLQRTEAISVVIPLGHETGQPLTDPFFVEMIGHLADEVTKRGYGVLLQRIVPPIADWLPNLIASRRCDGIIVVGLSTEQAALEEAAASYTPLVVWGAQAPVRSCCVVGTDNLGGARAAVEHLIRLGRRRVVFFGDRVTPECEIRLEGYRQALKRAAGNLDTQLVVPTEPTSDAAYEAMRAFIRTKAPVDAVFACSDLIAVGALRAITAAGLRVPADIAVVGFDDIPLAAYTNPTLTTVRQDIRRCAATLVDLVFRRIAGQDAPSAILPAELIVRESCGAASR